MAWLTTSILNGVGWNGMGWKTLGRRANSCFVNHMYLTVVHCIKCLTDSPTQCLHSVTPSLPQSHFASSWFPQLAGISKPLPSNLEDSCSWIWWLHSIHMGNTKMKTSQALCNVPEKVISLRRAQLLNHNFLFPKELAANPFLPQVFRCRACSSSGNRASSALNARHLSQLQPRKNRSSVQTKSMTTEILFVNGLN